ncbi:hypothetical protein HNR46_000615 [Haloferula luteola]|uniref:Uncharacterized protein n=1 Tax=Haloferula luteola TaxID=595692 RepID=A0A840VBY7_9BACT|nr:hypothetical protein [Haloferula luteola]MBB5350391.1 hypothetical protein [Haloferula luteola]
MPLITELPPLASLDAARPVFLILMGISLVVISWRISRKWLGWPARILMAGALLLGFGYSVILPLYAMGVLMSPEAALFQVDGDPVVAMAWQVVKAFSLNGGWLLFGAGLFWASRAPLPPRRPVQFTIVRP